LLAAKVYFDAGKTDAAKSALTWVAEASSDEGYQSIAKLRLAAVLVEGKAYDEALKPLATPFPSEFNGLVADRRADIFMLQGKKAEAKAEYLKAYQAMDDRTEYRRLVEVKLNAMGVDPRVNAGVTKATASTDAAEAKK
jgi:predicted negative regulator of RcsB-dependent stress response